MLKFLWGIRRQLAILLLMPLPATVLAEDEAKSGKGSAVFKTPKPRVLKNGACWIYPDGTYFGNWTGRGGSELMFSIGPKTWDFVRYLSPRSEPEKYHGPGTYEKVWITYTSADMNAGWLDTVIVNPDGKTGTLMQDGTVVATWNCGRTPKRTKNEEKER